MARSPTEVVNTYNLVMWNEMRPELVPEICADPLIRHYSGKRVELSHQDQIDRVEEFRDHGMVFERVVQFSEGEFVTWVWNCTSTIDDRRICGIEIFRVVDGLITEVWNSPYGNDLWG